MSDEYKRLSSEVKEDIQEFLKTTWKEHLASIEEEQDSLDITFATNDDGDQWNYQTGDNSFTGGCYSLPHWAVGIIHSDTTPAELTTEIIDQLEELLPENR